MKNLNSILRALSGCVTAAVLAGCGGSQPPIGGAGAMPQTAIPRGGLARNFGVLFSFHGSDGRNPDGGLVNVDGTLYGTTSRGGNFKNGVVYSISPSGSEKELYSFARHHDGASPAGALINVGGTLYGTTRSGGGDGGEGCCGTVFTITTAGKEHVLYTFLGPPDGKSPNGGLLDVNGTLYGTTSAGGTATYCGYSAGCGTVFSITSSGKEKVLYSFGDSEYDGTNPVAGLIALNGTLYGTTAAGGTGKDCVNNNYTCGTVFSITTAGKERVLHSFTFPDGANPSESLLDVSGALYGTTNFGGNKTCGVVNGCGTVFGITTSGRERVLYRFGDTADGALPSSALLNVNGELYGTTDIGGSLKAGIVYRITRAGVLTVVHNFTVPGGSHPVAGLTNVNGALYGTTELGGANFDGTVFSLKP